VNIRHALRAAVPAALLTLASCAQTSHVPPWLELKAGGHARLAASDETEPERTAIFPSAAAASTGRLADASRIAAAGELVTITQIEDEPRGKHAVAIDGARGPLGWVVAEDVLLPVPPNGTRLLVAASAGGQSQLLFSDQDDDDGTPFGTASHVTYDGFVNDPGNAEYRVHVDDGPLAGYDGYVAATELEAPETDGFLLVPNS
jgi:hypothetical protein